MSQNWKELTFAVHPSTVNGTFPPTEVGLPSTVASAMASRELISPENHTVEPAAIMLTPFEPNAIDAGSGFRLVRDFRAGRRFTFTEEDDLVSPRAMKPFVDYFRMIWLLSLLP